MAEFLKAFIALLMSIFSAFGFGTPTVSETEVMTIPTYGVCRQVQGGCYGNGYVYEALIQPNLTGDAKETAPGKIIKIDPNTWKVVAETVTLTCLNHANDLCYNPKTNYLLVSNNDPNYTYITALDADSLKVLGHYVVPDKVYSITYIGDTQSGVYYTGISGSYNIVAFDEAFNVVREFSCKDNGYTRQGMESDGTYLYFIYYGHNCIYRYTLDGKSAGKCDLPETEYEAENLFFIGDTLYVTYNISGNGNGGVIRRLSNVSFKESLF